MNIHAIKNTDRKRYFFCILPGKIRVFIKSPGRNPRKHIGNPKSIEISIVFFPNIDTKVGNECMCPLFSENVSEQHKCVQYALATSRDSH